MGLNSNAAGGRFLTRAPLDRRRLGSCVAEACRADETFAETEVSARLMRCSWPLCG